MFNRFKNNTLKNNVDKCHVLVSTNKPIGIKIGDYTIDNSECEKLLGVKIDVKLNLNDHISDVCKKASRKISALARVTGLSKRKLLMNAFFTVQLLLVKTWKPDNCPCRLYNVYIGSVGFLQFL